MLAKSQAMPSKNPKRQRRAIAPMESPSTSPFTYEIMGKSEAGKALDRRVSTTVTLSIPSADDECPLTLEPISQSKLDFLPDAPFISDRPLHSKLTLPCGHSFHALTLIYSWCKNGMSCPFCRAGHPLKADPACLPTHLKSELAERVRSVLEEERQSDALAEADNFRYLFNVVLPYATLVDRGLLSLRLDLLDGSGRTTFSLVTRLDRSGELMRARTDFRTLGQMANTQIRASILLTIPNVGRITVDESLVLHVRSDLRTLSRQTGETLHVRLCSSGRMVLDTDREIYTRQTGARVAFEVYLTQPLESENVLLNNIYWDPGAHALELLAAETEMPAFLEEGGLF